jgi:hypothetical protein
MPRWAETTLEERFWSKVDKSGGPDACWPWKAFKHPKGYGHFAIGGGRIKRAHRLAWELSSGEITNGLYVCHKCDNPACVNPAHLFLGTNQDNIADAENKGRSILKAQKGDKHPRHKLTEEQVKHLRMLYAEGPVNYVELAKQYGVTRSAIEHAVKRISWKGV